MSESPSVAPELIDRFLERFSKTAARQGQALYGTQAIRRVSRNDADGYVCEVATGSSLQLVTLTPTQNGWIGECTCLAEGRCKHSYAAALALKSGVPPVQPAGQRSNGDGAIEPRLVKALGRKLMTEEKRYVAYLRELFQIVARTGRLSTWDLSRLGVGFFSFGWGNLELWDEPPKTEHEMWLYLAHSLREHKASYPAFMEGITDFSLLGGAMARWARKKLIREWTSRLSSLRPEPTPDTQEATYDFRLCLTKSEIILQCRQGTAQEFLPMRANHFEQLANTEHGRGFPATTEGLIIWHAYRQQGDYYGRKPKIQRGSEEAMRLLGRVLRLEQLRDRVLDEEHKPLAWPAAGVVWKMQVPETASGEYVLELSTGEGFAVPRVFEVLPGLPTLYVTARAVYQGPEDPLGLLDIHQPNLIPAEVMETAAGLTVMQRMRLPIPPRLQEKIKPVQLRPVIKCRLGTRYPGSATELVLLELKAHAKETGLEETFGDSQWYVSREPRRPTAKTEAILYQYDRSLLTPFPALLTPLDAKYDRDHDCWRLRVTKDFGNRFGPWLASLPPELEVRLEGELESFLQANVKAKIRLDCEEAEVDWFDLRLLLDVADAQLTKEELRLLLDAQGAYVRLPQKGWRRLDYDLSDEDREQLARLGMAPQDFGSEPQRLHALQLADKAASRLLPEAQAQRVQLRAAEIKASVTPEVPAAIQASLRPYQVEGFHFLAYLATNRFGGLLADDMGLGKTLQTLAWLAWLRQDPATPPRPSLVVCPKSVMDNWIAEANRFYPGLRVTVWRGIDAQELASHLPDTDLVVVNYTQLRLLAEDLANVQWLAAILDEGQYIKNPGSQTAQAARALTASHRLILTGTPIENRLLDLWSLMAFAMPGVLGNQSQFARKFGKQSDLFARRRLAARVRPFLIRRTKGQVAQDLPDRIEEDLVCEMEGEQRTLYRAEYKRARQILLSLKTQSELNENRFHFLTSLLRLRQICCHPGLYIEKSRHAESAKVNALIDLLEPLMEEGHKVLVFSQFVGMLDLLKTTMAEHEWRTFYLAGETEDRGEVVEAFQQAEGGAVFLISLKAGGFGLNLTAASYVVLFDPWWNPAVENQAIDRTHRIGQTSKVIAYRLLIKQSIEEKIRLLQRQKRALAEDILGEESFTRSLTLDDLHYLFAPEED